MAEDAAPLPAAASPPTDGHEGKVLVERGGAYLFVSEDDVAARELAQLVIEQEQEDQQEQDAEKTEKKEEGSTEQAEASGGLVVPATTATAEEGDTDKTDKARSRSTRPQSARVRSAPRSP